jgi:hypothetical protein
MAALLIERGDLAGARKELTTALGYDRQNGPAIYNLALVSERDGKPAVMPDQTAAKTARPNPLARFFHAGRNSVPAKQVDNSPVPAAGPSADRAVVLTGSGSGN